MTMTNENIEYPRITICRLRRKLGNINMEVSEQNKNYEIYLNGRSLKQDMSYNYLRTTNEDNKKCTKK